MHISITLNVVVSTSLNTAQIFGDCSLVLLPENLLGPIGMGLVVPKDSPLKQAFDPM